MFDKEFPMDALAEFLAKYFKKFIDLLNKFFGIYNDAADTDITLDAKA